MYFDISSYFLNYTVVKFWVHRSGTICVSIKIENTMLASNKTKNKTLPGGSVTCHSSITKTLRIIKNATGTKIACIHLVEIHYREY